MGTCRPFTSREHHRIPFVSDPVKIGGSKDANSPPRPSANPRVLAMVGESGGARSPYEPEPVGREHRVAVPPMTAAPPGLALSGELRANAYPVSYTHLRAHETSAHL
eukprot:4021343-Alexandrium_andersonii.AAC.1